jgi:hypothetical protein
MVAHGAPRRAQDRHGERRSGECNQDHRDQQGEGPSNHNSKQQTLTRHETSPAKSAAATEAAAESRWVATERHASAAQTLMHIAGQNSLRGATI